ncbi:hypothetical protein M8C21_033467, partial [Ambrosia artemisiifolia]
MDRDDTSAVGPTRRCCFCHRILSSDTETQGSLESMGICNTCNFLFFEDSVTTRTTYNSLEPVENMFSQRFSDLQPTTSDHVNRSRQWSRVLSETESGGFDSVRRDGDTFPYAAYESDSDASVDVDTYLSHDDDDDDVDDSHDENRVGSSVGRIQLHRSLATNGRNRPNDWLSEILSDEGMRNFERRRLFGILEDQVLETSGYGDYVDVETNGSRFGAPAAAWFVKNLERVVVDESGSVCVICKDNLCDGSVVNRLPCGHMYHPSCIVPWLNARNTCPLCRYELPTDDKDRSHHESEVQRVVAENGGRRWCFVVAPIVSVCLHHLFCLIDLKMASPLGKLTIIIGAGLVGSVLAKEGRVPRISDFFSRACKVIKLILDDEKKTVRKSKPLNECLSQVNTLRKELQQWSTNRPVTIVTSSPSSSGGIKYGVIITVAVVGYGYVWWKGWKLPDMMFATKSSLSDATNAVAKQLETVYSSLAAMKRHLSSRMDRVDCSLNEVAGITATTKEEVSAILGKIKMVSEDVQSIHNIVYTLESRMSMFELKQDETNLGVERLIRTAISIENQANQSSSSKPALELPHRAAMSLPPVQTKELQSSPTVSPKAKRSLETAASASGLKVIHDAAEEARY